MFYATVLHITPETSCIEHPSVVSIFELKICSMLLKRVDEFGYSEEFQSSS